LFGEDFSFIEIYDGSNKSVFFAAKVFEQWSNVCVLHYIFWMSPLMGTVLIFLGEIFVKISCHNKKCMEVIHASRICPVLIIAQALRQ